MARATVYQVAEKAGVSIATVSRVLNNPEKVHPATRDRVLSAIDVLGFVPKAEAAARARKGSARIGVLAPFFTYPSFVARLRGVADALANSPYELVIYNVDSSSRRVGYLASLPVTRRIDGLIVMALPFDEEAEARLVANSLETVLIEFSRRAFSSVRIDDRAGGALAADYLLSRGHRRCAFVGDADVPDYALRTSDLRLEGYRGRLEGSGVELPDEYVALAPHSLEHARSAAHRLFDLPKPPTAIFAGSDLQALGTLEAARSLGLTVPRDLSIVGYDDIKEGDILECYKNVEVKRTL